MGFLSIPLKPSSALVFSIVFGISVDYSIHFLAKFKNELTINTSYEHYRSTDDAFNNNFSIYFRKPL